MYRVFVRPDDYGALVRVFVKGKYEDGIEGPFFAHLEGREMKHVPYTPGGDQAPRPLFELEQRDAERLFPALAAALVDAGYYPNADRMQGQLDVMKEQVQSLHRQLEQQARVIDSLTRGSIAGQPNGAVTEAG